MTTSTGGYIHPCQILFDDTVALVNSTLDVAAALLDGQEAERD